MTLEAFPSFERATRAPRPLPPPGSCDAQIHVFGDPVRYPPSAKRTYDPPDATFADAQRVHRALGIERCVIAQATIYGTDHRLLLDVLAGQPNVRGVAIVDDDVSDRELGRLHAAGIRGARFNFAGWLGIVPSRTTFRRSIARIAELGWFAKIHGTGDELVEYVDELRALKLPAIVDHMGHLDYRRGRQQPAYALIRDLLQRENWWVMLGNGDRFSVAGPPWDDTVDVARSFIELAPDRILWCTDWPHVRYRKPMPNDADLLELLYRYAPESQVQARILVDNPARIFGFGS